MNKRIIQEEKIICLMIELYEKKHKVCLDELRDYALLRLEKCPFKENKHFCSNCSIHCYNKQMQQQIKKVMKYSGPRIVFSHPIISFKHLFETLKEKRKCKIVK